MTAKRVFEAVAKAAGYVALFIVVQFAVSIVFMVIGGVGAAMPDIYDNSMPDIDGLSEFMTDYIIGKTAEITLISNVLTALLVWMVAAVQKKNILKSAYIKEIPSLAYIPLALGGACLAALIAIVMALLPIPEELMEQYAQSSEGLGSTGLVAVISTVIAAPVVEELVFRGLVYTRLRRAMPPVVAALLSSAVFGALHGQIIWMAYAFVLALVMCAVFERTGSILSTMVLHSAFNLVGGYFLEEINPLFGILAAAGVVLAWIWLKRICPYKKLRPEEQYD